MFLSAFEHQRSFFFHFFLSFRISRVYNGRKISYIPVISGYPKVPRGNYSATFFLAFFASRMPCDCRHGRTFFMKILLPSLIGIGKRSRSSPPHGRYRSPVSQFINRVENGVIPRIKVRFSRIFKRWQMTVSCNFAQQLERVGILIYFRRMEQIARIISCVTSILVRYVRCCKTARHAAFSTEFYTIAHACICHLVEHAKINYIQHCCDL